MDGAPWSFRNHPLILRRLESGDIPHEVLLNHIIFWVQVFNFPLGGFKEQVGMMLVNFIGHFLEYDKMNKDVVWRPYMRIRVEVGVSLPLKHWKNIKLGNQINLLVTEEEGDWRITGFYGYPERARRRLCWGLLRQIAGSNDLFWVCIWDFNDLLVDDEKRGRVPHPNWILQGFRQAVLDCKLTDLLLEAYKFTWSWGLHDIEEERLDRAMQNPGWLVRFP
ncbi:hypothetical protein ACS0TY_006152 [Phlomoides rotata]